MKVKVMKSGDKNFEEEKAKMFESGLTKEEQLKKIFSKEIRELLQGHETVLVDDVHIPASLFVNDLANKLLYEVKIRTKL